MKFRHFRKLTAMLLAACLLPGLTGCGGSKPVTSSAATTLTPTEDALTPDGDLDISAKEPVYVSGWRVYDQTDPETSSLATASYEALEQANKKTELVDYEYVSLLATQMVSGTNYCIFCRAKEEDFLKYVLAYVYEDNSGAADIISTQYVIYDYMEKSLNINKGIIDITEHQEVANAFISLSEKCDGEKIFTGFGYLGNYKDESGNTTGYLVFCRVEETSPDSKSPLYFAALNIGGIADNDPFIETITKAPIGV